MPHTFDFAGLKLAVSIETDPPIEGFDPVSPGQGGGGLYEWRTEVTAPDPDTRLLGWSLRRRDGAPFEVVSCTVSTGVPAIDLHRVFVPALYEAIGKRDLISLPWGVEERTFATWSFPFIALLNRDDVNRFCIGFMDHVRAADIRQSCYDEDAAVELSRPSSRPPSGGTASTCRGRRAISSTRCAPSPASTTAFTRCGSPGRPRPPGTRSGVPGTGSRGTSTPVTSSAWRRCSGTGGSGRSSSTTAGSCATTSTRRRGTTPRTRASSPTWPGWPGRVQEAGLRILLWCAPIFRLGEISGEPFVAEHLFHPQGQEHPEQFLCPRSPRVRAYAARMVGHLLRIYPVDGLKIDFIDPLRELASRPCQAAHEHDIDDCGEAVQALLAEMHRSITAVRPDALIEFRMNYSTLATRPFATSHRAQDAPFDTDHIRRMCTRLRSYILDPGAGREGNVAPHTDPAYWLPEEPVENVARFMASLVTSAVPMLSMDLRALPEEHRRLVRAWLAWYREHRDLLLFGRHRVLGADAHHSLFSVHKGEEALWGIFTPDAPGVFELPSPQVRRLWILNGSSRGRLCCRLEGWRAERPEVRIRDRFLGVQQDLQLPVDHGAATLDIEVEIGGALELIAQAA